MLATLQAGDKFEVFYPVSGNIYSGFIELFNDNNPLHTDEAFAKEKNFAGRVMHGAIMTGFLSNFIGERLPMKNVIVLSYAITFKKPVYLGDTLKLVATVTDVFESVNCADISYQFLNETNVVVSKGKVSIQFI